MLSNLTFGCMAWLLNAFSQSLNSALFSNSVTGYSFDIVSPFRFAASLRAIHKQYHGRIGIVNTSLHYFFGLINYNQIKVDKEIKYD